MSGIPLGQSGEVKHLTGVALGGGDDARRRLPVTAVMDATRRTTVRVFAVSTSLGFGVFAFVAFGTFGEWGPQPSHMPGWHYAVGLAIQMVAFLAGLPVLFRPIRRLAARVNVAAGDEDAEGQLLAAPVRAAVRVGVWWNAITALMVVTTLLLGHTAAEAFRFVPLPLLVSVAVSAVAYLSLERDLRPVLAGLIDKGGAAPTLSIRRRLLLLWLLVAAIPLLAAALSVAAQMHPVATIVLIAVALAAGPSLTYLTGDGLAARLVVLRAAVDDIERGDLSVRLPVDDTGEIGVLQAGFNRMAAGLAERDLAMELFGHHVGAEVASHAMIARSRGAEGRVASMLFVDVIDSTPVTVRLEPDEVVALLNDLFATVVDVVAEHGGVVARFMGDGALCLFGAPEDCDDHADRALATARALVERASSRTTFEIGVGVSAGPVVAGNVGAARRYEYTVIGRPVNEAARLVELAKQRPAKALASASAIALSQREAASWAEAAWFELRGFDAPTLAFEPAAATRQLRQVTSLPN